MAPRYTYSVNELVALRPLKRTLAGPFRPGRPSSLLGTYLSLWDKYIKVISTPLEPHELRRESSLVWRFSETETNKRFRRSYVRKHGTTKGLKDLPREPTWVLTASSFRRAHWKRICTLLAALDRLRPRVNAEIEERSSLNGSKPLVSNPPSHKSGLVGVRLMPRKPGTPGKYKIPQRRTGKSSMSMPVKAKNKRPARVAMYTHYDGSENYTRKFGGMTSVVTDACPPKGKWSKYWYFLRKNGAWHPSDHHPYGDEDDYFVSYDGNGHPTLTRKRPK